MTAALLLALVQAATWRISPAAPTVGDTIWVERTIQAQEGWVVRPGPWQADDEAVEALGPVVTSVAGNVVLVRYPLVSWEAGSHVLTPPSAWRIGPAGETDSVPGGRVTIEVASLLPVDSTAPRPPREPVERRPRAPLPAALALTAGVALVAGAWRWRRRPGRPPPPDSGLTTETTLAPTGDGRVDAARLAARLRRSVAAAVPAAHRALTTDECLAVLAAERPDWPLAELGDALHRLDGARFAADGDPHLTALTEEVVALERRL